MNFADVLRKILSTAIGPMTPQEIREVIKKEYPEFYGTPTHIRNVDKGYYKDIDHALLAQIYILVRNSKDFFCDIATKPMKISLQAKDIMQWSQKLNSKNQLQIRMQRSYQLIQYNDKVKDILENADLYHRTYYEAEVFQGPSLYFHQRALETRQIPFSLNHLEYIYATLSSWGMNIMGQRGSKMQSFEIFSQSILNLQDKIAIAQQYNLHELDDEKWMLLEEIFRGINVMSSSTSLIGNSKVMHHLLTKIIPPIDREYTLWFLRGNTNIKNDLTYEWQLIKEIISEFFLPVASDTEFLQKTSRWNQEKNKFPWDTSTLKIIDNLIIGSKKSVN